MEIVDKNLQLLDYCTERELERKEKEIEGTREEIVEEWKLITQLLGKVTVPKETQNN